MNNAKNDLIKRLELNYPLIVAPMAGGPSSVELVVVSSEKGALGSIGAAYMSSQAMEEFAQRVREKTKKSIGVNLFIPTHLKEVAKDKIENAMKETEVFRKEFSLPHPQLSPPYEEDFEKQFESILRIKPKVFSFIFGLLKQDYIKALKAENIIIMGTATSVDEALQLAETEIDAIVLQGFEAGGHRAIFNSEAVDPEIKTLQLVNEVKSKTKIPLIAAGGIMSSEDIKSMLSAGAHAVQMGTAFLCSKEAGTSNPYRKELLLPERHTKTTRAFSGRLARGIENHFMTYMDSRPESILPFPAQNKFTRDLRNASVLKDSSDCLSLWAGTGQGRLWTESAADLIEDLFSGLC